MTGSSARGRAAPVHGKTTLFVENTSVVIQVLVNNRLLWQSECIALVGLHVFALAGRKPFATNIRGLYQFHIKRRTLFSLAKTQRAPRNPIVRSNTTNCDFLCDLGVLGERTMFLKSNLY
jgi:hypothetical protein